jgi:hypothetical protein
MSDHDGPQLLSLKKIVELEKKTQKDKLTRSRELYA